MDGKEIAQITETRFAEWSRTLRAKQATPTMVIGTGHDDHEGEIFVLSPPRVGGESLVYLLEHATRALKTLMARHEVERHDDIQSRTNGSSEPGV